MTLEELQQDEWYLGLPEIIQKTIDIVPPIYIYKLKESGKHCTIVSYEEPESNLLEEVTVTVQKIGVGGTMAEMGMGALDTNRVFDVKPSDLLRTENT